MKKTIGALLLAMAAMALAVASPAQAQPHGKHNPFCHSIGGPTPWVYVCDYSHPHLVG